MLRNYILNTQGSNNRNLPEEIEKFMNTYTEHPQGMLDQTNEKRVVSYAELNSNEKQLHQETDKVGSQTIFKSPIKEDFFDDISKVIQMEHSSAKANIFRKASAPRNVISQLIFSEEPQQNQKVEKLTNFFEAMYDPFANQPNLVVPAAQFIDDPKLTKFTKSPTPNYVEENNQVSQPIQSFEEKVTVSSPALSTIIQTKSPPVTRDFITRIGQVDINDFSGSNSNGVKVQTQTQNTESSLRTPNLNVKYYSSDSNEVYQNQNLSRLKKENTVMQIDRFTTDSGSTSRQEPKRSNELLGEQYRQPKLIVSSLINRSVFSTHNSGDFSYNKSIPEPSITVQPPPFNPLSQPLVTTSFNRTEETNTVNHLPVTTNEETRRKSSASIEPMQFINAPLDKISSLTIQPTVKTTDQTNERSTHDSGNSNLKPVTIKITTNSQQKYSANSFTNINNQTTETQKTTDYNSTTQLNQLPSIQATFENANLRSSQAFYQYSEPKNVISVNYKSIKYPNSEVAQEKEIKSKVHLSTEPSHFNKSNSMHSLIHDFNAKKNNGSELKPGDRMLLPLEVRLDSKASSILPNMTTLHREINTGTTTTTNSNRSTVNAFVNHNDEDNSKYLQTLNYFSSARNLTQPLKQFDIDSMLDSLPKNDETARRATDMNSTNRTSLQINKPPLSFSSKIIKLPGSNQIPKRDN